MANNKKFTCEHCDNTVEYIILNGSDVSPKLVRDEDQDESLQFRVTVYEDNSARVIPVPKDQDEVTKYFGTPNYTVLYGSGNRVLPLWFQDFLKNPNDFEYEHVMLECPKCDSNMTAAVFPGFDGFSDDSDSEDTSSAPDDDFAPGEVIDNDDLGDLANLLKED
jgi:hypothetical protein